MKPTDRFFVQAKTGHWLASMEKGLHWGGRRQAATFSRAQIDARKELTGAKLIPAVRDNPGTIVMREIDHGFYRISDRDAGRLAKATPLGRLPRLGYELRDVRLPDGRTAILIRTPYSIRTDSPRRGWVWALYRIEAPRSNPRRASEARAKKRAPAKLRRRHRAIRARRVRRNPDPRPTRHVKLTAAQVARIGQIAARRLPAGPLRHQLQIAARTVNMPAAIAGVMGGPSPAEAQQLIARLRGGRGRSNPAELPNIAIEDRSRPGDLPNFAWKIRFPGPSLQWSGWHEGYHTHTDAHNAAKRALAPFEKREKAKPPGELVKTWRRGHWKLQLFDLHRTDDLGKSLLAYRFFDRGQLIFSGEQYHVAPHYAIDSAGAVYGLLGFLALRPGDTDDDYFKDYTPAQREWAEQNGEELSILVSDWEERQGRLRRRET